MAFDRDRREVRGADSINEIFLPTGSSSSRSSATSNSRSIPLGTFHRAAVIGSDSRSSAMDRVRCRIRVSDSCLWDGVTNARFEPARSSASNRSDGSETRALYNERQRTEETLDGHLIRVGLTSVPTWDVPRHDSPTVVAYHREPDDGTS